MPLPRIAARLSTHVATPFMRHLSGRLPWFATVEHVGRRSGRTHRTPANVYLRDGHAVFALVYGADAHWVRNVLAAGGCRIETQGRQLRLHDPELVVDASRRLVPPWMRPLLRIVRVDEFLMLHVLGGSAARKEAMDGPT